MIGTAALAGGAVASRYSGMRAFADSLPQSQRSDGGILSLTFDIAERQVSLPCFSGKELPLWTFQESSAFPVVRLKHGQRLQTTFKNSLPRAGEHATIHWHGLRIPNREDGVPYLTQEPILPGAEGVYDFVPPDTGTYFFHTHCNSVEHFGRGLFGALIVEGDEVDPSDHELVLLLKDWRLSPDGAFLPFTTDAGAAKAGTNGTVRAINGTTKPVFKVPSSANVRVRLLNVDPARISEIGLEGADAAIIAVDGNACKPISMGSWRLGPAERLDILIRSAASGGTVQLMDYFSSEPIVLAEFVSEGAAKRQKPFKAVPLRAGRYAPADIKKAERLPFSFSATATGKAISDLATAGGLEIGTLCLSKRSYWAINQQSWSSMDSTKLGPPLATLKRGQSYILELKNLTPQSHPIHIHGHTYEVLTSNIRQLPPHRADTVLLLPNERIEVAIVAGETGKWMLHCHILEHQEAGMMGHFVVI